MVVQEKGGGVLGGEQLEKGMASQFAGRYEIKAVEAVDRVQYLHGIHPLVHSGGGEAVGDDVLAEEFLFFGGVDFFVLVDQDGVCVIDCGKD